MDLTPKEKKLTLTPADPAAFSDKPVYKNKPLFVPYYAPPAELQQSLDKFNLSYARCKTCPRFATCPAIKEEREWFIQFFDVYFAEEYDNFVGHYVNIGAKEIPRARYDEWRREMIRAEFDRQCTLEIEGVSLLVEHLRKSYDLSSGKTYLLIRELLTNYLHNFRIDEEFGEHGLIRGTTTVRNDSFRTLHAGAKSKVDFSRLLLDYIKMLDDITKEGVTIDVKGTLTLRDVMENIVNADKQPKMIDVTPSKDEAK